MRDNYLGLRQTVEDTLAHFFAALYPKHFGDGAEDTEEKRKKEMTAFNASLAASLEYFLFKEEIKSVLTTINRKFPEIARMIETDIQAAYEGDPAAMSTDEVILTYPAFPAVSVYRLAHELYLLKVPVVPRMMSEIEHSLTGIDIHPGAAIGPYFFIDHGTGVVIGETTTIGEHVKLYQHVTLGAKSFELNPDGTPVKGIKRHPDVGDRVVIYSGATVLGGRTVIGHDAVIGGNTWVTWSVEPFETVSIRAYRSSLGPED